MNIEKEIEKITTGSFNRSDFPEDMKANIAKTYWNDLLFGYGMEYGALLILYRLKKEKVDGVTTT